MKILCNSDVFFRNFRYLKRKNRISRQTLALLLEIPAFMVDQLQTAKQGFALDYRILRRTAQIFDVDETVLMTVDLEHPVRPLCGPQQEKT